MDGELAVGPAEPGAPSPTLESTTAAAIEELLGEARRRFPPEELAPIERAIALALEAHRGQVRASKEPYVNHPLSTALILLREMRLDARAIAAAVLHDVPEDTPVPVERVREDFGEEIARLVDGVTKLGHIDELSRHAGRTRLDKSEAESLRKMFLAMAEDVRVILIKLADRLHNMQTLWALPEGKQQEIARETLEIFAPLANRLGMWYLKAELEDLALKHLEPETHREIADLLAQSQEARERFLSRIIAMLKERLAQEGLESDIHGRAKHIYSIYRKMQQKGIGFDRIYDLSGVRIIVGEVQGCYAALGIVHTLWHPIAGEFDDYISMPKDNLYQSLHTAVVGPEGQPLEVQIRTREMHQVAEYGVAAHWRYKEGRGPDWNFDTKVNWLRQVLEWQREIADAEEFVDALKTDLFLERVYVFTPKGDIIDLPAGATPVDFAYRVHTSIGHRCRGAKVNGRLMPLNTRLKTGDQVEVLTTKKERPSRDWLNSDLGYIVTSGAAQKIRQWFRRQDREKNIAEGRQILEKELGHLGLENTSYEEMARLFRYGKVEDFLAAIGYGDIQPSHLATRLLESEREQKRAEEIPPSREEKPITDTTSAIRVGGVGSLFTRLARCCNPVPGDDIVGYVTRGRGITIHRRTCPNLLRRNDAERSIAVTWEEAPQQVYPVDIVVVAIDREGLLRDVGSVVADERVNISAIKTLTDKRSRLATMDATLEITGMDQLVRILTKMERLPNVLEARRKAEGPGAIGGGSAPGRRAGGMG